MADFINTVDVVDDELLTAQIIERTITEYKDNTVTNAGNYAFYKCTNLITVDMPEVITTGNGVFEGCTALETINVPKLTTIRAKTFNNCKALKTIDLPDADVAANNGGGEWGQSAFQGCAALEKLILPKVTTVPGYFFYGCSVLTVIDLSACTKVNNNNTFGACNKLVALIFRNTETVVALNNANNFPNVLKSGGTGHIYVPAALVDSYKAATNWSTFASQFRALEDYTIDGTVTGALDESKI